MVTSWLENNNVSEQMFNTLVSRFLEQGILYDSRIYADNFIQVLDGVQVAIVGCVLNLINTSIFFMEDRL